MMLTDSPAFAVGMMLAGLAACTAWYGFRLRKNDLPVSAALLGFALFGQTLSLTEIAGVALVVIAVVGMNVAGPDERT